MIWRTRDGHYLVQGDMHPIYTASSGDVRLPNGTILREAAEYYEFTDAGTVVKGYSQPLSCSLDDWFYISNIHVVIGSQLCRFMWSEKSFEAGTLQADDCGLSGLVPYAGPLPFETAPGRADYRQRMLPRPPAPWDLPPRQVTQPPPEFAALEALCVSLQARGQELIIARPMVERLFTLIDALESACQTAEALEFGAEGVDNTTDIRRYSQVKKHLLAAIQDIASACAALAD